MQMESTKIQPGREGSACFRSRLQEELVGRCRANPRYSLRAFARMLDISPSALSAMLNGRRPITQKSIERLGLGLSLPAAEIENFKREAAAQRTENLKPAFQPIPLEVFALISDWYHDAILELMKVEAFQPDAKWIANALGISRSEANIAIERLQQVGLIAIREDGRWEDTSAGFSSSLRPQLSSAAARKLQRQILEASIQSLAETPLEQRSHSSMTMAIDPADLPEASARIQEFRRSLCAFLERNGRPKEVYQLSVSLFPASKTSGEQK